MIVNKVLDYIHNYTKPLYENSIIIQNIDKIMFCLILLTFVVSTVSSSDLIGHLAIATTILTVARILIYPKDTLKVKRFELFLLAYFMIVLVSVAGSSLLYLSIKGFMKTFIYLSFYISVVHHLKHNSKNIIPILITIAGCATFESLVGMTQSFAKVDEISGWQDMSNLNPEEVITRVYGTLQPLNPNLLGGYLIVTVPAALGLCGYFLKEHRWLFAGVFGCATALICSILFMTGCRGSYIALFGMAIVAVLISLKVSWHKYKKLYITISSIIASLGTFAFVACTPLRVRILSIFAMRNDSSNSFRFNVYKSSFQMFKDNWLVGIGQGNQNFREVYGLYMKTGFDALSAYNIYLETAVESGIFALIAFLGFLFSLLYDAIKYIKKSDNIKNILIVSIPLLTIIGTMCHGMVDTVFFRPQIQIVFWTMCAILSNRLYEEC